MSDQISSTTGASTDAAPPPPHRDKKFTVLWGELKKAPLTAQFGLIVILCYIFAAVFAPVLTPYGEAEIVGQQFELMGEGFV